jgi:hypothetical protein
MVGCKRAGRGTPRRGASKGDRKVEIRVEDIVAEMMGGWERRAVERGIFVERDTTTFVVERQG